jgi:hypothetical protein
MILMPADDYALIVTALRREHGDTAYSGKIGPAGESIYHYVSK